MTLRGPLQTQALTPTEVKLLIFLAERDPCTPEDLATEVFGRRDVNGRGRDLVYRHIANLREKLERVGAPGILTRSANGYGLRITRTTTA